jgi:hypothetical protein
LRRGLGETLALTLRLGDESIALPLFPGSLLQSQVPLMLHLGEEAPTSSHAAPIDRPSQKPAQI